MPMRPPCERWNGTWWIRVRRGISTVRLRGKLVLRACITSHETCEADLDALIDALAAARKSATLA